MPRKKASTLKANLFLLDADQQSFSNSQFELLAAIEECGSITAAAKRVGISYKTAWDRIDAMNNLSDKPLVSRSKGGAKGGGTKLTDFGRDILLGFIELEDEHAAYVDRLGTSLHSMGDLANFLRSNALRSSARNQFRGLIEKVLKLISNLIE